MSADEPAAQPAHQADPAVTPDTPRAATPTPAAPPSAPPSRGQWTVAFILLAFLIGIGVALWGAEKLRPFWHDRTGGQDQVDAAPATTGTMALQSAPATARSVNDIETRLAGLSARMESLSTQAQSASAYASRAEAIMVAFAARRALDNGSQLGYLENELRVRFGESQPRAVATIITAAREPVTLGDLQAKLADLSPTLTGIAPTTSWWESARREITNLVIIRKASSPSPVPLQALTEARRLLDAGRVEAALGNVESIPANSKADGWLQMARRYNEARRALDLIEAAAILEPRAVPVVVQTTSAPPRDLDPADNAAEVARPTE